MAQRELLRPRQAAEYLALSESYLATLRSRGGGPNFLKLGAKHGVRYDTRDLDAWLDERKFANTAEAV